MTKGSEPEEYDALIVGVGASGSVFCKELAKAGLEVLALDAGPYLKSIGPTGRLLTPNPNFRDSNDEVKYSLRRALMWNEPETWRSMANEDAVLTTPGLRHRCVGGPLVYAGQALRFHESDFREKSESGAPKGTGVEDWPISYADLEPYYEKAEFELGVSGKKGADPFEAPRKNEFPFPPLEEDYNSALFSETCERLGYHPAPTPLAILPRDHNGRGACNYCGNCQPYPCYVNAKASPLITIIPQAEKTGLCHIRPFCYVTEVVVNRDGDAKGVKYLDKGGRRREARGKIVILCNLGAYVARLLLLSKSQIYPKGIGNNYDQVGKYIMGFGVCDVFGSFDHQLIHSERTGPLSIEHICDFDEDRPKNLHGQDFIRGGCIHPGSAPLQGPIS
nr:GMC family oxidoreductase [Nitrososphaerota archaeon]